MKNHLKKLKKEVRSFWAIYSNSTKDWRVQNSSYGIADLYNVFAMFGIFASLFACCIFDKPAIFFCGFFVSILVACLMKDLHACLLVYFYYKRNENEND